MTYKTITPAITKAHTKLTSILGSKKAAITNTKPIINDGLLKLLSAEIKAENLVVRNFAVTCRELLAEDAKIAKARLQQIALIRHLISELNPASSASTNGISE